MDVRFDIWEENRYSSSSQKARVFTENWVSRNMYCPRCGAMHISHFENNRPVADFYCPECRNEYELKSKNGVIGNKINDGAYATMIERITGNNNPDFLFMSYSKQTMSVKELVFIPKYFFVPEIIEKRAPLAPTARRAGWVGCNILIGKIPLQGRIYIIADGKVKTSEEVVREVNKCNALEVKDIKSRGWLMDILNCLNRIKADEFDLGDMYAFENELELKHPLNRNIRPKIRQQLQVLRDKGYIGFIGKGRYRKIV